MFSLSPTNESRYNLNPTSAIGSHGEYQDIMSVGYKTSAANKTVRPNSTKKSEMYLSKHQNMTTERHSMMSKNSPGRFHLAVNISEARSTIRAKNFGLYYEQYEGNKDVDRQQKIFNKQMRVAGDFRPAYLNDKTLGVARKSDDAFLATAHTFDTFMGEREDLPRLSILSNYEQIMKIMHANYIKS